MEGSFAKAMEGHRRMDLDILGNVLAGLSAILLKLNFLSVESELLNAVRWKRAVANKEQQRLTFCYIFPVDVKIYIPMVIYIDVRDEIREHA